MIKKQEHATPNYPEWIKAEKHDEICKQIEIVLREIRNNLDRQSPKHIYKPTKDYFLKQLEKIDKSCKKFKPKKIGILEMAKRIKDEDRELWKKHLNNGKAKNHSPGIGASDSSGLLPSDTPSESGARIKEGTHSHPGATSNGNKKSRKSDIQESTVKSKTSGRSSSAPGSDTKEFDLSKKIQEGNPNWVTEKNIKEFIRIILAYPRKRVSKSFIKKKVGDDLI